VLASIYRLIGEPSAAVMDSRDWLSSVSLYQQKSIDKKLLDCTSGFNGRLPSVQTRISTERLGLVGFLPGYV